MSSELVGQTLLNRYRVDALLGRGGMAEVYRAFDTARGYDVAIKVLREDLAEDRDFVRRFRAEARALSTLAHANIVRFYEFSQDGPLAFLVMDYVPGITLRRRLGQLNGSLPPAEFQSIVRQVGAALTYAHHEGVIHRDVKPGNIMLAPDGRALLSDFGIAKLLDSGTVTTVMPGTPAYMSPEQIDGKPLDARTDIYSFGIVIYEIVTGRRPFVGDSAPVTEGASTREQVRWEHLHAQPPDPRQINPALSPPWAGAILRALAKDPVHRWRSISQFVEALIPEIAAAAGDISHSTQEPTSRARPAPCDIPAPGPQTPAPAIPAPRHGAKLAIGLLALGFLIVGLAGILLLGAVVQANSRRPLAAATQSQLAALASPTSVAQPTGEAQPAATSTVRAEPSLIAVLADTGSRLLAASQTAVSQASATAAAGETLTAEAEANQTQQAQLTQDAAALVDAQQTQLAAATQSALATTVARASQATATPACADVTGPFRVMWEQLQGRVGCAAGTATSGQVVEENFQGGKMLWREPIDTAQALVLFGNGAWSIYQHAPFVEGSPDYPCPDANTPAQSPPTPRRGFGTMWCDIPAIRNGLGNATDAERGFTGQMQQFDKAFMVGTDYGATFVFFSSGSWERR